MVSCAEFLRDFSEYRDGYMDPAGSAAMEAHHAGCAACARYSRVLDKGIEELRSLPGIEPSYDFHARLQHRIYNLEERARFGRREGAGTSALLVAVLIVLMAAVGWWPERRPSVAVVELPPVAASVPKKADDVHALFRPGPLLTPRIEATRVMNPAGSTVFFRYAPLGTYAGYPMEVNWRR
jgi:anti-sigma factor RsiW